MKRDAYHATKRNRGTTERDLKMDKSYGAKEKKSGTEINRESQT